MEIEYEIKEELEDLEPETICLPSDFEESTTSIVKSLPEKSKARYLISYEKFNEWCSENKVQEINEEELLKYFLHKSETLKSSSLWSEYSMLKTTLSVNNNIDISQMRKLISFLKKKAKGYKPRRANIFSKEQINEFLLKAPDRKYLMMKVALIFGIAGACRRHELTQLTVNDIKDLGDMLVITIPDAVTKMKRTFTVSSDDDIDEPNMLDIYRKYLALRPSNIFEKRFFLTYRLGKCSKQPVGINVIGKIPYNIALFLQLPNPEAYTGHSFRRSSSNTFVDSSFTKPKKQVGLVSSSVCIDKNNEDLSHNTTEMEGHFTFKTTMDSISDEKESINEVDSFNNPVTDELSSDQNDAASENKNNGDDSESEDDDEDIKPNVEQLRNEQNNVAQISAKKSGIIIKNCTNCTININFS